MTPRRLVNEKQEFADKMFEQTEPNPRWRLRSILASLVLGICVQGCITRSPVPTSVPAPTPESVVESPDPVQLEIERLLLEAGDALLQNRLTTPAEDCAYYRYLRVLTLDPANREARQGINDIVEKYLDWAIRDADGNDFKGAESYLNKARTVDETHPNIVAVAEQIAEKSHARIMTYRLSTEGLNIRAPWITEELMDIGVEVLKRNATVVITARSDAEARWIYQQLNQASGETRVRAEVKMGALPSVRLVYLAAP
jgi:hypothetical protein|tara:strand:- start:3541 stop:4308 length:768 start_codon:yes stop_codon:yes gene_type:complete